MTIILVCQVFIDYFLALILAFYQELCNLYIWASYCNDNLHLWGILYKVVIISRSKLLSLYSFLDPFLAFWPQTIWTNLTCNLRMRLFSQFNSNKHSLNPWIWDLLWLYKISIIIFQCILFFLYDGQVLKILFWE